MAEPSAAPPAPRADPAATRAAKQDDERHSYTYARKLELLKLVRTQQQVQCAEAEPTKMRDEKMIRAAVRIVKGLQKELVLGNINSLRDWGHAKDYVEGMWLILQHDKPDDFVMATGEQHSVKEFCDITFRKLGVTLEWRGSEEKEVAYDAAKSGEGCDPIIRISEKYYRPTEVETLLGDPTKAKTTLGWKHKFTFDGLVDDMVQAEIKAVESGDDAWNERQFSRGE
jgi:GDP-D-mannose dehydratase